MVTRRAPREIVVRRHRQDTAMRTPFTMPLRLTTPVAAALILGAATGQAQWTPLSSGTTASLRGLSVVDGRIAWASGTRGTVVHTSDGGATWRVDSVPGAGALDLRAVHARSGRVAHVAATSGRIYRTTDGGATWSLRYRATDTTTFLDAIDFWDDRNGIALGDPIGGRFVILRTRDGGETWEQAPAAQRPAAVAGEAAFAASGSSLIVEGSADSLVAWLGTGGTAARLHRTVERGARWEVFDTPIRQGDPSTGIFSVARVPGGGLVVVGGHYAENDNTLRNAAATRTGAEWRLITTDAPRGYRSGVAFARMGSGATIGIAVGPGGSDVSTDGGMRWAAFDSVGYHAVRASRDGIFFASGSGGRVARFDPRTLPSRP